MTKLITLGAVLLLSACARLDHVQINDIDQSQGTLTPISVKTSENAVELAAVAGIAAAVTKNEHAQQNLKELRDILALMNMGPRTGNPVFNETYAEKVLSQLYSQCPSGNITGISNVREARSYGPVSGEIVRIDAFCIQ